MHIGGHPHFEIVPGSMRCSVAPGTVFKFQDATMRLRLHSFYLLIEKYMQLYIDTYRTKAACIVNMDVDAYQTNPTI